jgi:hypothetical protein
MKRTSLTILAGIVLTCITDMDHNEYTSFQVDGPVYYNQGKLQFQDIRGDEYRISDFDCSIMEGTLRAPGADMRREPAPNVAPIECPGTK